MPSLKSKFKCPKSCRNGPFHEPKILKILLELCTEGTLGQFWRACRRRPNLTVGHAACDYLKWLVERLARKVIPLRGKLAEYVALRELGPKHPFNLKILCAELCTATVHIYSWIYTHLALILVEYQLLNRILSAQRLGGKVRAMNPTFRKFCLHFAQLENSLRTVFYSNCRQLSLNLHPRRQKEIRRGVCKFFV